MISWVSEFRQNMFGVESLVVAQEYRNDTGYNDKSEQF